MEAAHTFSSVMTTLVDNAVFAFDVAAPTLFTAFEAAARSLIADGEGAARKSGALMRSFLSRERLGSTAVANGVAIPHVLVEPGVIRTPIAVSWLRLNPGFAPDELPGSLRVDRVFLVIAIAAEIDSDAARQCLGVAASLAVDALTAQEMRRVGSIAGMQAFLRERVAACLQSTGAIVASSEKWDAVGAAVVMDLLGIHARPAMRLADLASTFECEVVVLRPEYIYNLKSIMETMLMTVRYGEPVTVCAKGPRAAEAVKAVLDMIRNGFDEE